MQKNNIKDIIGTVMIVAGIVILALSLFLVIIHNKRINDEKEKIAQQKAMFVKQHSDAPNYSVDSDKVEVISNVDIEDSHKVRAVTSSEDDVDVIEIIDKKPNELLPPFNETESEEVCKDPKVAKENTEGYIEINSPQESSEQQQTSNSIDEADNNSVDGSSADNKPKKSTKKPSILDTAIAYIDINKIEVSAPVFPITGKYQLRAGVGVVDTTDMPSADINTCCVVAGHRGGRNAELNFFRADELDTGDTAVLYIPGFELTYTVVNKIVVKDDDWSQFYREPGKNKLILMTCHPYPANIDRLLIICEMTDKKEL